MRKRGGAGGNEMANLIRELEKFTCCVRVRGIRLDLVQQRGFSKIYVLKFPLPLPRRGFLLPFCFLLKKFTVNSVTPLQILRGCR